MDYVPWSSVLAQVSPAPDSSPAPPSPWAIAGAAGFGLLLRGALLFGGAAAVYYLFLRGRRRSNPAQRRRRNPARRRNPYPDHSRRKWASYANTVSRRERARTGYAFPRVEPNSHVGDLVEWLNFASIVRPSLRGVGSRLLRQIKSKGESVIRDRAWRLIGNLSERDEF